MFRQDGRNLVSYAAGKDHCSFYVQSPAVMEAHAADMLEGRRPVDFSLWRIISLGIWGRTFAVTM